MRIKYFNFQITLKASADHFKSTECFFRVGDDVFGDLGPGFAMRQVVAHPFYDLQPRPRHSISRIPFRSL